MIKLKSTGSYSAKKRSAVDGTAAEWNHVAKATFFMFEKQTLISKNITAGRIVFKSKNRYQCEYCINKHGKR